jgi:hypothetical protein
MSQAALLHPLAAARLVERLQAGGAARDPPWPKLLARRLFATADDGGSASLSHVVSCKLLTQRCWAASVGLLTLCSLAVCSASAACAAVPYVSQ